MTLLNYIDLYCERTAPGFLNEPVNAASNAAFLIAAWIAWRAVRSTNERNFMEMILIVLAASIGVGSFLFHTLANGHAELLDVIPIWTFVALYVCTVIFRLTGGNAMKTVRISFIAICCTATSIWMTGQDVTTIDVAGPDHLNGSLQYSPALIALWVFAGLTVLRAHPAKKLVTASAVLFTVSLALRTVDLTTCHATGIGTHFLWHFLNGAMVLALLLALIRHIPACSGSRQNNQLEN
ncbi:MAG: ceramidase domain-containing protein [Roseobacter sp.]